MSSFSNLKWSFYGKGGSGREGTDIHIESQGIIYQNIAKGKTDQRVVCLCRINCVNNYNWLSTSQFSSAAKYQGQFQSCQLSWSYCQCFPEQHSREHYYQNMHLHHHQVLRTSVWVDFFISQFSAIRGNVFEVLEWVDSGPKNGEGSFVDQCKRLVVEDE